MALPVHAPGDVPPPLHIRCIDVEPSFTICDHPACMLSMKSGRSIMRNCRERRQNPTNIAGPRFDAEPLSARRADVCMMNSSLVAVVAS
jgi:hypothetical protein